ncbi:MAG TPA: nucleotidyltransferase [Candidatus Eisenbergiella merdigallinarum]|uniref:Nucleotidyltransferase n=1 Tax=Candidatus Eisenbergiella merdigallinarum TaxID=2838552 RepID=A0A9D2MRD7_9FIRM|nr:nucleotidyltransferase [Candidatus Eisenbergiella merdigallinarum]
MEKPVLVILAAGMGSRYGGLKQIDPVDDKGHKIIDFSIYDAVRAGFGKVVFIIKKENEKDFRECVGDAVSGHVEVEYVFQELDRVPEGFRIPEGRVKPWGTAHAILCCKDVVDRPFAVINADDYYGRSAFEELYRFLTTHEDDEKYRYAMVGYQLGNTLTENGSVARGVCVTDEDGYLQEIAERTKIVRTADGAAYTEDDGKTWVPLPLDTPVSMNMWAFSPSILKELEGALDRFFAEEVEKNPLKSECYLPIEVDRLLRAGKATVEVLHSADKWFGVTYKEDKPFVMESIRKLKEAGVYPDVLW